MHGFIDQHMLTIKVMSKTNHGSDNPVNGSHFRVFTLTYLEHSDGLGVKAPVVTLPHAVLVGEVHQPAFLDCL